MIRKFVVATALLAATLLAATAGCTTADPGGISPGSSPAGISSEEAGRIQPLAPRRLTAVVAGDDIRLTWPETGEDVSYYQCLRRLAPQGPWQPIGRAQPPKTTYLDPHPAKGTYIYGVQVVNGFGTASAITESPPITID